MARSRKRHVQQSLAYRDKNGQRRGGKRPNAGRPKRGKYASERHKRRSALKASQPVHVTLRVSAEVGRLRRRKMYAAFRDAMITTFVREIIRVVHISIQSNHVHLIVEARDRLALARGMQGFQISAAKLINSALANELGRRRRGCVFMDRYHADIITSPRRARHCLAYVLNNWRKHREDRSGVQATWTIDPFSSGDHFAGWKELADSPVMWRTRATYKSMPVWQPRSWLLREGWRRYGLIGAHELPGPKR